VEAGGKIAERFRDCAGMRVPGLSREGRLDVIGGSDAKSDRTTASLFMSRADLGSNSQNCTPAMLVVNCSKTRRAPPKGPCGLGIERLLLRMSPVQVEHDHALGRSK